MSREALAFAAHRFKCILSLYVLRQIHVVIIDSLQISFKELCFVWAMTLFEVENKNRKIIRIYFCYLYLQLQ